jgi:hypothetical protein
VLMWFAMLVMILLTAVLVQAEASDISSKAFCLAAIFKGLQEANPGDIPWSTSNLTQQHFMTIYGSGAKADLPQLEDKVEAMATADAAELNAWFAKKGFPSMNIKIQPSGRAIGIVFDLLIDWKVPGKKVVVQSSKSSNSNDHDFYDGVKMTALEKGFIGFKLDGYNYPLFLLNTRQGWQVYLVEVDVDDNPEASELPARAKALLDLTRSQAYNELNFPAVQMIADVDITWIEDMKIPSFRIEKAIKKVKFRLDEKGARAQSAVAFSTRGLSSYYIERPFYIIFTKEGMNFPPFVAIAAPDVWKKIK